MHNKLFIISIILFCLTDGIAIFSLKNILPVLPLEAKEEIVFPIVSLTSIFSEDHSWTASVSAKNVRTMIVTGDVLLARSVNAKSVRLNDFFWPFRETAPILQGGDVTFINLETPLISKCPLTTEGMVFCGDIRNSEGLKKSGIDVINFANNHVGNYGSKGIQATAALLKQKGFSVSGLTGPVYVTVKGLQFAFLGYNDVTNQVGIAQARPGVIKKDILEAKQKASVVVVQFHWGQEYTDQATDRQRMLAHEAIDAGADVVIGNHPHWMQPIEIYRGKIIAYSYGNFVFDQLWSQQTREGLVGRYTFYDNRLIDVEFMPIEIRDYGQPVFLTGRKKEMVLGELAKKSSTTE